MWWRTVTGVVVAGDRNWDLVGDWKEEASVWAGGGAGEERSGVTGRLGDKE